MVELRIWQRRHVTGVVAEVTPVAGIGTWEACAWHEPDRAGVLAGGPVGLLSDAMAAADALAITSAGHTCDARCGKWEPTDRRSNAR
jgi:hypothetical protein